MTEQKTSLSNLASGKWQGIAAIAAVIGTVIAFVALFMGGGEGGSAVSVSGEGNKVQVGTAVNAGEGAAVSIGGGAAESKDTPKPKE